MQFCVADKVLQVAGTDSVAGWGVPAVSEEGRQGTAPSYIRAVSPFPGKLPTAPSSVFNAWIAPTVFFWRDMA
jgi:hypothetical protein